MNGVFYACSACPPSVNPTLMRRNLLTTNWTTADAWIPNVIFQQTDGPTFRKGFPATWAFGVMAVIFVGTSLFPLRPCFLFIPDVSSLTYSVTVCTVPVELLHRREVLLETQSKEHSKDEESKSVDGETDSAEKVKAGVVVQTLAK